METKRGKKDHTEQMDSSYRTYEEWKPGAQAGTYKMWIEFLPYLWGMETR